MNTFVQEVKFDQETQTPNSWWSALKLPDPKGDRYRWGNFNNLTGSNKSAEVLIDRVRKAKLVYGIGAVSEITERLHYLHRNSKHCKTVDASYERRLLPMGELTDETLANKFFNNPTEELMEAVCARLEWIVGAVV